MPLFRFNIQFQIGRHYSKGIYSPVTTSGSIITNDMVNCLFFSHMEPAL